MTRYTWKRALVLTLGIAINALGIVLITKANLGTTAVSSLPLVLSLATPLSLGTLLFIFNSLYIVGQMALYRRDFQAWQWLQLGVNLILSLVTDWSSAALSWLQPGQLWSQILCLVLGCAVLAFGIALEVAVDWLYVSAEGIVQAISTCFAWPFGRVKITFDGTITGLAVVFSFLLLGGLEGVGWGTLISAFLIGRFVAFYQKNLPVLAQMAAWKERDRI
ncbi:DUF6198 family protein [Aerococcus sp. UMB8623]|uniref:YczE/YyaS/YitT family protein n=1 Tax=Aerococcus sp. UMB8623 TaxID=3046348 RepID=UPI00254B204B|nr:DUF6198 family protein [Aerococcus sp. UMB8623]MDK6686237.1 DUF6198 family protein [Aerococcus sp. UMB8623]